MLGQPISMLIPDVVGFELNGEMREGITATDLVLQVVQMLRTHGVVGKFVGFYGSGLDHLPLADRATIANMAPDFAATLHLDMSTVEPNLAGPKRPQDRATVRELHAAADEFIELLGKSAQRDTGYELAHSAEPMHHGDVAIAAITSCTNTSNPAVTTGAGL